MLPAKRKIPHPALEEVQEFFERWRKDRKGRDPIPPALDALEFPPLPADLLEGR
ncbi:MAG: hypothetical protein ABSC55_15730 [Syntrophorhabdales bacterium]|jgi:hypothetical protein